MAHPAGGRGKGVLTWTGRWETRSHCTWIGFRLALDDGRILLGSSGSHAGTIGRAGVAMIHAGWAMLLSVGDPINTHENVIPALNRRFGNNSRFYGFITGASEVYLRAEIRVSSGRGDA